MHVIESFVAKKKEKEKFWPIDHFLLNQKVWWWIEKCHKVSRLTSKLFCTQQDLFLVALWLATSSEFAYNKLQKPS